jgi:hypothetical protein
MLCSFLRTCDRRKHKYIFYVYVYDLIKTTNDVLATAQLGFFNFLKYLNMENCDFRLVLT